MNETPKTTSDDLAGLGPMVCSASLTLTQLEIRDLAKFCGMIVQEPTPIEAEDEKETEVTITRWPAQWPRDGVMGDDGFLVEPHKHIAYFAEYPEEGFMPLGMPNTAITNAASDGASKSDVQSAFGA